MRQDFELERTREKPDKPTSLSDFSAEIALRAEGEAFASRIGSDPERGGIREADRLECEAWNAIMWAAGPAMPSPGDPRAEPTIGKAIRDSFDHLEAKCNRCDRVSSSHCAP